LLADENITKFREFTEQLKSSVYNSTIRNYFGRCIHFTKEHAILNNYIQSTAADFLNNKFVRLIGMLSGPNKIILQNHDSILLQMSTDAIANTDLFERVIALFQEPISGIFGRIEYEYGKNWGEMS
jgi:DNA polymerase I-like protein with 3'-5' exonuclease and polymerase domains